MTITRFKDRSEAGRRLAVALARFRDTHPIVLGLPRGGVPVASEVATVLHAPLDVLVVRKLGAPFQKELALGAVGEGGAIFIDDAIVNYLGVSAHELEKIVTREQAELERRVLRYRRHRPICELTGQTVIVIDDGIATGSTARAALQVVRSQHPKQIILAAPVAAPDSIHALLGEADEIVVLEQPRGFQAVGEWYDDFGQTTDEDVTRILKQSFASGYGSASTERER